MATRHLLNNFHVTIHLLSLAMSPWLIALVIGYIAFRFYRTRNLSAAASAPSADLFNPSSIAVVLNLVCVSAGFSYFATLNSTARFVCVASTILNSGYIIITNYGVPQVSRNSIKQPLQEYFARSMSGAEFPFLYFAMTFSSDYATQAGGLFPLGLADIVSIGLIVRRSIWFLGTHGSKAWTGRTVWKSLGSRVWGALKANETRVMEVVNLTEIVMGFWVIILVFTPARNILTCFVYWTYLRIKYMAPRSRLAHQAAWSTIDKMTQRIQRSLPFIEKPKAFMVNWFNQGSVQ